MLRHSPIYGSRASAATNQTTQLLILADKNGVQRDIVLGYDNTSFYRKHVVAAE
jgi:hypothetical protein